MEQYERIRRDARDEGLSVRALARKHKVHRRTVRQALGDAMPPPRKIPERVAPVLGPPVETVRGWLVADADAPRKQRHTARRVWERLRDEQGAQVAESSVRALVAQLRQELGTQVVQVMVPQTHPPAEEAEVDFGEFWASIGGVMVKLWMFVLRLSFSGRAVHIAYANQAQESFLDGHVQAFERLGGVPTGQIRYDNLKAAVLRVALGRDRLENVRFIALRSHYGFEKFFCLPGEGGAHEKGGVEGEIGRFRRRHLTPVPDFPSLAALNDYMARADVKDDRRRITGRANTVGQDGESEAILLRPLPVAGPFDAATVLSCRVDSRCRVCVRQAYYSVPARYAGRRVQVRLGARTVTAIADGKVVAEHVRSLHKYTEHLTLDHYLEVLTRKPGALPGATALVQARACGAFTPAHQAFWNAARAHLGDKDGTRALIGVLLLHRTLPGDTIAAVMREAVTAGRFDPEVLAVQARTHRDGAPPVPIGLDPALPADPRPIPSLTGYDTLLGVSA